MFFRIRQFLLYLFKYNINNNDIEFIHKYLNNDEIKLFNRLQISEQKHCINVAISVKKYIKKYGIIDNGNTLIKASILHDIGKVYYKLNLFDRVILVVLDKLTSGKIKIIKNNKKVYIFYYHPYIGYKMLKNIGEDEKILYLVNNHHNKDITDNISLNILKKYDDRN